MLAMVGQARLFTEHYDEEKQRLFYYNFSTEEALWDPPKTGYTKQNGTMVLSNGQEILKKDIPMGFDSADGQTWCVECEKEIATKFCNGCQEPFCDSCFSKIHKKGKRKKHTFTHLDKKAEEREKRRAEEAKRAEEKKQQQLEEVLEGWERHVDPDSGQPFW